MCPGFPDAVEIIASGIRASVRVRQASPKEWFKLRIKEQLVITVLVVAAMVAGFAARSHVNARDPEARVLREDTRQLSAYASNTSSDAGGRSDVDLRPLEVFYSALQHVREDYVEPIQKNQEHELTYGALRAMLDSLRDPQTRFLEPKEAAIVEAAGHGKFNGIGAALWVSRAKVSGANEEQVVVETTLPGSPARKAGLLTGDVITTVDGKNVLPYNPFARVENMIKATKNGQLTQDKLQKMLESENERIKNGIGFQKAIDQMTTAGDKEIALTVSRPGVKAPVKIKVQPALTTVDPVSFAKINPTVGYIRVNLLIDPTKTGVADAVAEFRKDGVKSIVLDLRDCPGGSFDVAQTVAGSLMSDRRMSILQMAHGKQRSLKANVSEDVKTPWTGPVAVIVNKGTAGTAEVLAAAVRDGVNAQLVGSTTFGDNLQQTYVALQDGSAVTMTTGKYLTPKGGDYQNKGLVPNVVIAAPTTDAPAANDPVVAKAVQSLAGNKG